MTERDDLDYVRCDNCDSPCYQFELDAKKAVIVSGWCAVCGNDDPKEFAIPDSDEDIEE
jgi:hypothetical protein